MTTISISLTVIILPSILVKCLKSLTDIEMADDGEFRANLRFSGQIKDMVIHTWIVDTSIEYDQTIISGFLKISLLGLTVISRNERYLLRRGNIGMSWMNRLNCSNNSW